jgi:glucokinase
VIVLAGDTGGTSTRLGIFEVDGNDLRAERIERFANARFAALEEVVTEFLSVGEVALDAACFAVAGPVRGQRVRLTNLDWEVDASILEGAADVERVELVNDLEATAWAVAGGLPHASLTSLQHGSGDARGNGAVIAAGTGLGEAGLYWDGHSLRPFACEGGHTGFSPLDEVGDELLQSLRADFEWVSWERVVSGSGLVAVYRCLLHRENRTPPAWFVEADRNGDPVPMIVAAGLESRSDVCRTALEFFARVFGAEASNLALKLMATSGVWIAGGIAPKILPILAEGHFMRGFLANRRMRPMLERVPVRVVLDESAPLVGAVRALVARSPER